MDDLIERNKRELRELNFCKDYNSLIALSARFRSERDEREKLYPFERMIRELYQENMRKKYHLHLDLRAVLVPRAP